MNFIAIFVLAVCSVAVASPTEQGAAANSVLNHGENRPAPPGCYWDGTAPFCVSESCRDGYTEAGYSDCGDGGCCWTGHKTLCCKDLPEYATSKQQEAQEVDLQVPTLAGDIYY